MICPFVKIVCGKEDCMLWVEEDKQCAVRLMGKSLSELSTAAMTINREDPPCDVEEDLPFC